MACCTISIVNYCNLIVDKKEVATNGGGEHCEKIYNRHLT